MACNIKTINRDQIYLMPPSLQEWQPEKDMAWFVIDVVEQMDLSRYYQKYREDGRGQEGYDPAMNPKDKLNFDTQVAKVIHY